MKQLVMTGKVWTPDTEWTQKYLRIVDANRPAPSHTLTPDAVPKTTIPVTTPAPDTVPKVSPIIPIHQIERESFPAKTGRVAGNYFGKMVSGVGAAFTNLAGSAADVVSGDKSYLERPSYQAAKARGDTAYTSRIESENARISSGLKSAGKTLTNLSDRLAVTSGEFQAAADADTAPVLRPVLQTVSDLVPFFALNLVPGAGQAAAGAYLVGETTGDARRAGLSEASQAALGFASVLSMGAAGQVGKALGSEKVVGWFLKNGKGAEFVRVLEQAVTSGLATGVTRQVTGGVTKAAFGVYAEQVEAAQRNLETLSGTDTASLTPEQKAAYESAVAANQAVVNSHGMDFTAALVGIALEVGLSIALSPITYGKYRAKRGSNFTASDKNGPTTPEKSVYFKGVTTPEEAHQRLKELSRRYHPDISKEADAETIMKAINAEYDSLGAWMKACQGQRVKNATDTWAKAKAGQGVTKAEADAANRDIVGLLQSVREAGDADALAAMEQILAPMAAEIHTALEAVPVPTPEAVPVPATPETAPATRYTPETLRAMQSLSDSLPPPSPQSPTPFVTFDEWRKLHPEIVASADAAAQQDLSALLGQTPVAPTVATPNAEPLAPIVATPEAKPAAPIVATSEAKPAAPIVATPETKPAAPTVATPEAQASNAKLQELSERLNQSTRVYMDGLKFEYGWSSPSSAYASIRRIDPEEENLLYPIQNAANDLYNERYSSDSEARNALIQIAATLPGFRSIDNPTPGYPVRETASQYPKEAEQHERRGTDGTAGHGAVTETDDRTAVLQSPVLRQVASGLDGAVEAENVSAPEGTGEHRGVVSAEGRRNHGDSGGKLQHAGTVGGTGNRPGDVHDRPGSGLTRTEADTSPELKSVPDAAPVPAPESEAVTKPKKKRPAKKPEAPTPEAATPEERTETEIRRKTEQAAAPRGTDFTFPEGGLQLPDGEKSRAKANLAAIGLLRQLESEQRPATADEQTTLSRFVGWGGLSGIFDENKADWAALRGQLRGMLSDEEYAAAAKSTLNAHYTSQDVIEGVYAALEHIGFRGGRVLEPSAGIGHFAGAMPANLRGKSRWTMVELDPVSGGITKALYPNADVRVQGFEDALLPDNYYDAAISNVPFGDIRVHDKRYKSYLTRSIHNYFFVKALDKVRPGGVVAFVTSRYTMDSTEAWNVRRYLSTKADLLGAVRLPDTAFKSNAGTDVVTDILILRKREPNTPYAGEAFAETQYQTFTTQNGYAYGHTNEYFLKHPEMVLGVPDRGKMYGGDSLTYHPKDATTPLKAQIQTAFASVTETMHYPTSRTQAEIKAEIRRDAAKGKVGGLVKKDGKIYRNVDGKLVEAADVPKKAAKEVGEILSIRDAARTLLSFQQDGAPPEQIETSRRGLNALYDDFVKRNGALHLPKNQRLVKLDIEAPFIFSIEKYDKDTKTATKADIFTKNTVAPDIAVSRADTVEDALAVSLNETGTVDPARIAALMGETPEAVTTSMLERGLVFLNRDGGLETAERYLSGNVRAKLIDAKALAAGNPAYNRNVEALEQIIPPDIEPENIKVQIGATWVPPEVYSAFAGELSGERNGVSVTYNRAMGEYRVEVPNNYVRQRLKMSVGNTTKWGTKDKTFLEILSATLNNKDVNVWRKRSDGSRILDQDATNAVKERQKAIQAEFQDWLFRDQSRREPLSHLYNDVFNNSVTPRYDGSKLTIKGMNTAITLNPHQKNAVHRIVNSGGNTLLAHRVGAGKTFEMAAAAMKLRELGVVKKPMFVVPKSLTGQWGREFLDLFPAGKILVPGDDFSAASRKEYVSRIATGDYDAVILSYEQFKAIPMSDAYRAEFIKGQIAQLAAALEEEKANRTGRTPSVKQMEKKKANLEAELKTLMDKKEDSDNINFEALGVDSLFVDEAHNFKNLFYTTHMNNVTGLGNKEGSQQAFDLLMKVRYLQKLNGGRGIVFATATPIMNSVVELYTMQNYLQPEALAARGIYNFDAWANQFAEVRTELQISPSGQGGRLKDTLSRYNNLNALQQMTTQFMDVVTDIPGLKIPKMRGGKRIIVRCKPSERQIQEMNTLGKRAEALQTQKIDPKVDNILKIGTDGRKLSYSQHMIDPSLPYEEEGKIMQCSKNVFTEWKNSVDILGTQIIFCDYFTPKASTATGAKGADTELSKAEAALDAQAEAEAITLYQDMKNIMVGMGIPANEIAFIHDAKTQEQRNQLFDDMNAGKVRVLMGSTGKMGVGMNAQKRVVALHHLDAPQRPGDLEQREGRALRQGNINDEVAIYTYETDRTFDARSWDILQRKWTFIVQLESGDFTGNSFEGDSDVLFAAEIKAIASGNPLIQEQFELTADIQRLEGLERAHKRELYAAQDRLRVAKASIAADTETAAKLKADIATRLDMSGKNFALTLDGKTFAERKAAGEALISHAKRFLKPGQSPETTKKIGTFAGFDLLTTSGGDLVLRGQGQYRSGVNFESAVGTVQSLEAAARKLDGTLSAVESRLAANRDAIPELERASAAPFAQASELQQKRKRAGEILVELSDERKPSGEAASASEPVSAFRDTWEVVDDDSGVLKFREVSAAKTGSHPDRWTAERVGDRDVKPLTGSEVIAKYRKIWDKNVTTGHIRGARGQYQHKGTGIGSGGIRLKIANDVPVFTHELGHALDEQYHLSETLQNPGNSMDEKVRLTKDGQTTVRQRLQARRELISNLDPKFAAQYKDKELLGEGIAEFFRRFCQNRVQASVDYPETYRFIMTTLSGTDQAQLLAMADDINALYSLDTETAQSSIKHMDAKAPDYRTKLERLDTLKDRFIQATVDSLHSVKKLSQMMGSDVYKKFYNAAYADSRAYFNLTEYLCDLDGQYIAPSLRTVLHGVNVNEPREFDAFGEYLVVRNAPSWIADDKRVLANDRKNNLLYCELREKELEQQHPMFKATSEALYDFWDKFMRTYVVGTGLISQEQYDAMRAKHPFYVPFKRVMDDKQGFGTRRTFANQPNPIQRAKGSGRDIIHPVESMINAVAKLTYQGIHQRTMLDLIDTADAFGLDAAFMERVPTPIVKQSADISGVKAEIAERVTNSDLPESDAELLLKILDEQADIMEWYSQSAYLPKDCISVRRNGEREVYKINDPLLFDALANMGRPYLNNEILKSINKVTRNVSALITGYNITWNLFSNAPRDIQTALISSKGEHRAKLLLKTVDNYLAAVAKARNSPAVNPYYMEYLAMGGGDSSAWGMDTKLPKKILSEVQGSSWKQRIRHPLQALKQGIQFFSGTIEAGPRFATYEMCREDGMDPQTAFRAAMEVTVDFHKGGKVSRTLNAFMPFFNAGVQGMVKDMDMLTHAGKKGLIVFLVSSLIAAAMEYALNGMTEERRKSYQRLSTYTKNSYYCVPIGEGKYFGIPKARGLLVPENFFRAALERTIGGNRHAYDGFWGYAATAEFPNGISDIVTANASSLFGTVTILGPMAQIWANADFRGMPIESARDRKLSPRQRYTGSTSLLAKSVGNALNVSPKQIDFFGSNTLGAAWQYQKALFPVDASKRDFTLGVKNKYVKDSLYSQDSVNRLYDLAEKSSRDSMDDLTDIDNKVTAYFDGTMTDFYSRYNSIAKAEDDAGQSDRAARELVLTLIEDYLSAREDGTLTAEQEAVYKVCRTAGDTSGMLPSARQNTVKDGNGTVHNLTAAQYYDYQGNFNSLYWNLVKEALPGAATDAERESVLKYAVDAAGEMSKNNVFIKLGAATTKEYGKYEQLQLYSVPISTYLVAKAKTKDIESLKDKRTGNEIPNSKGALVAETVLEMNLDLPETNVRKLMETVGVGKTVRDWKPSKLERELKRFRKEAGVE